MPPPALHFLKVSKSYQTPSGEKRFALREVSLIIHPGEVVAVVGRSGSGKSTFLHLAAGIDQASQGEVRVAGAPVSAMNDIERTNLRRNQVGLIFQFFHLLPHLSVEENIALPEMIAGGRPEDYQARIDDLLERVELGDRAGERVEKLSGGEMQRVAVCRAMLRRPSLLLADEPTGNLDDTTGRQIMAMMLEMTREEQGTLVYVTHSPETAALADRCLRLHSGELDLE
jgi:ABC-type lipoprotein export system ATPase subunit